MKDGNDIKKPSGMWLNHETRLDIIEREMKHAKQVHDLLQLVCFGLASIAFTLNIYAQLLALKFFQ